MEKIKVEFRKLNKDKDQNFIFNSWLKSNRNSYHTKHVVNDIYFFEHKMIIQYLMDTSDFLVAVNPEDPDQIYGYICYEHIKDEIPVIHYIYVKYTYRKLGIAKQLLTKAVPTFDTDPVCISHFNKVVIDKLPGKDLLVYNPYLLGRIYEK